MYFSYNNQKNPLNSIKRICIKTTVVILIICMTHLKYVYLRNDTAIYLSTLSPLSYDAYFLQ